jgi:hypothetical protein
MLRECKLAAASGKKADLLSRLIGLVSNEWSSAEMVVVLSGVEPPVVESSSPVQ